MAEDRGFAEGVYRFFANIRATYHWLRRPLGSVLAVLVLIVGAGVVVWWNWNELRSRPGVDSAVQWFQPETFPVPVLGQLNVAVTLFEGDTADEQRRRVILEELRKISGVTVLPMASPVGTVEAIQAAAAEWSEHIEASVYIGGKVRDVHGRKLVDLIWFAPAPPQEHWTTIDYLIRDEVTVIPSAGPEHIKALLPIMVEARIIDARDTLDQEFRERSGDDRLETAAKTVESESLQWNEPLRRAAQGVLAQAYAAHRQDLQPQLLQKAVDLYAQLDREEPNGLWGERMADSLQRLGSSASSVYLGQRRWRADIRKNEQSQRNNPSFFDRSASWGQTKPDRVDHCIQVADLGMGIGWSPPTVMRAPPPPPMDSIGRSIPQPPGPSKMLQGSVERFAQALRAYESTRLWSHSFFAGDENRAAENKQKAAVAKANFDAALPKLHEAVEADLARLQAISNPTSSAILGFAKFQEKKEISRAQRQMAELAAILGECQGAFTNQRPSYLGTTHLDGRSLDDLRVPDEEISALSTSRKERQGRAGTLILEQLRWEIGLQQLEAAIKAYRDSLAANVTHPAASDVAITRNNLAVALQAAEPLGSLFQTDEAQKTYLAAYNDLSARQDRRAIIVKRSLDRIGPPTEQ